MHLQVQSVDIIDVQGKNKIHIFIVVLDSCKT